MSRIRVSLALSCLAVFTSGCMNGGTVPSSAGFDRSVPALLKLEGARVRIREFADLPQLGSSGYFCEFVSTPGPGREFAQTPQIGHGLYCPTAVTAGPDGLLWVTDTIDGDFGRNAVVGIATSGARQHVYYYNGIASQGASFQDIVDGPDGMLWITDSWNGQILRLTAQGVYTGFPLPNSGSPQSIVNGPDKALWFTGSANRGNLIGRITTKGHITVFPVPAFGQDITAGRDGALWYTEPANDRVARISLRGKVTEYSKGISNGAEPFSIAAGPDRALWFTEPGIGRIGRITTAGKVIEYSSGITPTEQPIDLAVGPDQAMWFTEYESHGSEHQLASKIGRITMQGKTTEYSKGVTPTAAPTGIAAGPDSRMWFVETDTDKTGRISL